MSSRMTLVLLPGLDGTGRLFKPFVEQLPRDLQPFVLSYPPDEILSYSNLEEFVLQRLPTGQRYAILGESFSGPIALRIAGRAPEGLVGLVLVASFVRSPMSLRPETVRRLIGPCLFRIPIPAFVLRKFLLGYAPPADLVAEFTAAIRSVRPGVLAARVREVLAVNATEALKSLSTPVLYISGDHDRVVSPDLGSQLKALNPNLEWVSLNAPHLVLQRRPNEAADVIARFLAPRRTEE
jgi:pimeloyl-[acyl-carrier protein] methyl ester esterase